MDEKHETNANDLKKDPENEEQTEKKAPETEAGKEYRERKEVDEGKFFAAIAYISFLCIVSLLLKKENKFTFFHAKQGLVLFVFQTACLVVSIIPGIGPIIKLFGILIAFVISLRGIFQAMMGKYTRIPVVADIADKIVL